MSTSLLLGCLQWHSAFSQGVPHEANVWKRQWQGTMRQIWGLDAPAWGASQIEAESAWRDGRTSSAGAMGLAQFIPSTAQGMERLYPGLASMGRYSPKWSFYANGILMRDLYREFGKDRDKCNGIMLSGAGYNGSPSTLRKEIFLCTTDLKCDVRLWEDIAKKSARAPQHWRESRNYVARITRREPSYAAESWGVAFCVER